MASVGFVASVAGDGQLALALADPRAEEAARPSRRVSGGPTRLLRRLVANGLDDSAIEAAAALVVRLDEDAA
jgi:hypothetical protein